MPQATNLVIPNGATTPVNKTFELINPAAGDGGITLWALKEGPISAVFPQITAMAKRSPKGRNLKIKLVMPSSYSDSVTGLTNVGSRAEMNATISVPDDFPETLKADYVAFATGLFQLALVKTMMRDAYPAT